MKQKVGMVVLVIIILAALGFIVKQAMPKKPTYGINMVDVKAKKVFQQTITVGETTNYPLNSPYTGENTAYPADQCMKCGTIFAYIPYTPKSPTEEPPSPEIMMPKCPKCGSFEITVPEIPQGVKEIDVNQDEIPIVDMSKGTK
mgnify:CR=1 FL=1